MKNVRVNLLMGPQHHEECGEINIADGASYVFALLFGWVPATAYVGVWEFLWRIRHRKKIKEFGKNYQGKWLSNVTIGFAIFVFGIFSVIIIGHLIAMVTP